MSSNPTPWGDRVPSFFRNLLDRLQPPAAQGPSLLLVSRTAYVLLIVAALATIVLAFRSRDADHWVQHSVDVRSQARVFFADLQDAVIRERGLLLTGEDSYLGSDFDRLLSSLAARLEALRSLVSDNPEQGARLTALDPDLTLLTNTLVQTVALTRSGQRQQAVELVRSNRVQDLVKQINAALGELIGVEERLLKERQSQAATLQTLLLVLIGICLAVAAALSITLERSTRTFVGNLEARAADLEAEMKRRRETEATLQQAQKMEAVGQLTGGIAHDFNNLLTVIMGNLDMMKRSLAKPDLTAAAIALKFPKHIDMALQASRNAAKLTHRLLAFARRQPLEPTRVDCNRLVMDMSDMLWRTLGETINFETVLGGGLWQTFVDANQLESALLNLAVNAQHAMPNGGRLTIETANAFLDEAYTSRFGDLEPGQYVQVSVADTGTGIPPGVLERVFEPFFTTKPAEAGSGLGLAMVHGFVKQSGGHVRIYSEVGHGTTVKMYFRRHLEGSAVAASPSGVPVTLLPVALAQEGKTVLVVEDNDGVRAYASAVLSELGYTVCEAADAAEALALIEGGQPIDLLFTDVVLPGGVSGRQLSDQVKGIMPGLPVLFTTGYTPNAIVHHGRLDPGVHLISKPYTQHDLARKVSQLLRSDGGSEKDGSEKE